MAIGTFLRSRVTERRERTKVRREVDRVIQEIRKKADEYRLVNSMLFDLMEYQTVYLEDLDFVLLLVENLPTGMGVTFCKQGNYWVVSLL